MTNIEALLNISKALRNYSEEMNSKSLMLNKTALEFRQRMKNDVYSKNACEYLGAYKNEINNLAVRSLEMADWIIAKANAIRESGE